MLAPEFSSAEEVQAMSADNRPMAVLPRTQNAQVALDLLPRVRYRVRLGPYSSEEERLPPSLCFESGVLICPEAGGKSAVVLNLSDRIASLCSGSRRVTAIQQQQQLGPRNNGGPRWRTDQQRNHRWVATSTSTAAQSS